MNDVETSDVLEAFEDLNYVFSDKSFFKAFIFEWLDVFKEIEAQHFKIDAQMISEVKTFFHSNNVVFVFRVLVSQSF